MFSRVPDRKGFIMSIANGTTHYDYPQVQLTDRPTFADFNPAFADIDAKLYGLTTGAETDEQAIADLGTAVGNLRTDLGSVSDVATAAKNKADANEEAIGLLSTKVSQNTTKLGTKIDSNAIAEPYDTSTTYTVGDVVTYQGQRYRCITAVAVAEPFDATKWTGEDVQTVLEQLGTPSAADVTLAPITGMSASDAQAGIAELNTALTDSVSVTATSNETASSVFNRLYALIDESKITPRACLILGKNRIRVENINTGVSIRCSQSWVDTAVHNVSALLKASSSEYLSANNNTISDVSSTVLSGTISFRY